MQSDLRLAVLLQKPYFVVVALHFGSKLTPRKQQHLHQKRCMQPQMSLVGERAAAVAEKVALVAEEGVEAEVGAKRTGAEVAVAQAAADIAGGLAAGRPVEAVAGGVVAVVADAATIAEEAAVGAAAAAVAAAAAAVEAKAGTVALLAVPTNLRRCPQWLNQSQFLRKPPLGS